VHIIGNMLTLSCIGPDIADRLGQRGVAVLWVLSPLDGALGFTMLSDAPAPMVGASGAIFGLLGGVVALDYLDRGLLRAVMNMTGLLALLNIATLILERGGLAWETHLGGYLAGLLVVAVLIPTR